MEIKSLVFKIIPILFFFLSLFVYIKYAGPIPFTVSSVSTTKEDSFSVSGTGKATIAPDSGSISVGIQATGDSAQSVKEQLSSTINKVTDGIKNLGVESKDIKTQNYTINPNYEYNSQSIKGYNGSTNLTVSIHDLDKAGKVVDSATANGANQVGDVQFSSDDKTKAENDARTKAVEQAKSKAVQAAQTAGFKLGKILNYSENPSAYPGPYPMSLTDKSTSTPTQLQPGSNEISVTVSLTYKVD